MTDRTPEPSNRFATGDRVRITLNATVTDWDASNEDLTVHYSTVLGSYETTVATDSSYIAIADLKAGRLTDAERTEEAERLSEEELRFIAAALINTDGPGFDALLLDLKRRPSGLEEVTH